MYNFPVDNLWKLVFLKMSKHILTESIVILKMIILSFLMIPPPRENEKETLLNYSHLGWRGLLDLKISRYYKDKEEVSVSITTHIKLNSV